MWKVKSTNSKLDRSLVLVGRGWLPTLVMYFFSLLNLECHSQHVSGDPEVPFHQQLQSVFSYELCRRRKP